jgi:hypothetical protein
MTDRGAQRGLLRRAQLTLDSIPGPLSIDKGGTSAATAAAARSALGIGSAAVLTGVASKWTPTLTNVDNLDGSTAFECLYIRLGSIVVVAGRVSVNPTAPATPTTLSISLPVASNFGAVEDAAGVAFAFAIAGQGAAIEADVANDRLSMKWVAGDINDQPMSFIAAYEVI